MVIVTGIELCAVVDQQLRRLDRPGEMERSGGGTVLEQQVCRFRGAGSRQRRLAPFEQWHVESLSNLGVAPQQRGDGLPVVGSDGFFELRQVPLVPFAHAVSPPTRLFPTTRA